MNILMTLCIRHWKAISGLMLLVITAFSLAPADRLPSAPGTDKLHHALAYAALMFPAALAQPRSRMAIALFYLGWSGAIEWIQPYVHRHAEWADLAANAVGIGTGWLLGRSIAKPSGTHSAQHFSGKGIHGND